MPLWVSITIFLVTPVVLTALFWWVKVELQNSFTRGYSVGKAAGKIEGEEKLKMELMRKFNDSGRRAMARPGTTPAKIHKAQIGPIQPNRKPG